MKTTKHYCLDISAGLIFILCCITTIHCKGTIRYWNGDVSQSWVNATNFQAYGNNLPGVPQTGDTVYLETWATQSPLINNSGNATLDDVYVNNIMAITNGGVLGAGAFEIGQSDSAIVDICGGAMSVAGTNDVGGYYGATALLNMSSGSLDVGALYLNGDGDTNQLSNGSIVSLTGGTITVATKLSIDALHPCLLDIAGGTLVLTNSGVANFSFWVNASIITAYGVQALTNMFALDQTNISGYTMITANYPGFEEPTFPQWDPELMTNLPSSLGQAMAAVPPGLMVLTNANYSFGTTVFTNGNVYFTEYGDGAICEYSPTTGTLTTNVTGLTGVYGIAVDTAGNLFYGQDFGASGGQVVMRTPGGVDQTIITNITAPRQLTADSAGNVYAISEAGEIIKWTKSTGLATVLLNQNQMPRPSEGIAVSSDGRIFFCTYAVCGGQGTELTEGSVWELETNGVVKVIAGGISRGRGLALDSKGNLYVAAESSVWDDGNSGVLVKIDTNGVQTVVLKGLDYPQFPAFSPDGNVYFTLPRDNELVCYDPTNSFTAQTISGYGLTMIAERATWQSSSGYNLPIQITLTDTNNSSDKLSISGYLQLTNDATTVNMWLNVPVTNLNISLAQIPDGSFTNTGVYQLPAASVNWSYGSARAAVIPLREHLGCRWPQTNIGQADQGNAPGFAETPSAYLVFIQVTVPPSLWTTRYWNGNVSQSWTNANNFQSDGENIPGTPQTGDTLYLESWASSSPLINNSGNAALNDVHANVNMTMASGGALSTTTFVLAESDSATFDITGGTFSASSYIDVGGYQGGTATLDVTGGTVNVGGLYLNYDGASTGSSALNLTGGTINESGALSINTTHTSVLNLTSGTLILPYSQLGNVNYWIGSHNIEAYAGSGTVNLNTNSNPGKIVVTGVP